MRDRVITVSTRAAAGGYDDRSGPILVDGLRALGCEVDRPELVADGEPVRAAVQAAVDAGYEVVLTTGGTGVTPTDRTPEMTRSLLDFEIPGIAEALRLANRDAVPTAVLSRGLAGVAGSTLVVNLPGSPGGCRDGLAVLAPLLEHAVEQIAGSLH